MHCKGSLVSADLVCLSPLLECIGLAHASGRSSLEEEADPAGQYGPWTGVDDICQIVGLHREGDQAVERLGDGQAKPQWS